MVESQWYHFVSLSVSTFSFSLSHKKNYLRKRNVKNVIPYYDLCTHVLVYSCTRAEFELKASTYVSLCVGTEISIDSHY